MVRTLSALVGGILSIIVALAGIGTAVVLFPMREKQNEALRKVALTLRGSAFSSFAV